MTSSPLNVLSIGGSRNIGFYSSLKLLHVGATVTFLLRDPSIFDNNDTISPFLASGQARVIKGDALVKDDVARAWSEAARDRGQVDFLLFTLGGKPNFHLTKGFTINPPNLVTQSLLNALCTLPHPPPKIITISSAGLTPTSHASLPFALKPVYSYLLAGAHADKIGAERILHHCTAGWSWNSAVDGEPGKGILGDGWKDTEGLPEQGSLKQVIVLRPSMFTDGESVAEKFEAQGKGTGNGKPPYRVSTDKELKGWTISRKDVAHFVVDVILNRWNEFENRIVNISY